MLRSILTIWLALCCLIPIGHANPVTRACSPAEEGEAMLLKVPQGAIWKTEHLHPGRHVAPPGYATVVGWINVATALPCATRAPAMVEIRAWRVIEHVGSRDRVVQQVFFDSRDDAGIGSNLFPRCDPHSQASDPYGCRPKWFGETTGTNEKSIVQETGRLYLIDANQAARRNFHAWGNPRVEVVDRGARYSVEVEARITGQARLQLGTDWWRTASNPYTGWDGECEKPGRNKAGNCEAWISRWHGDTNGKFVTIRESVR